MNIVSFYCPRPEHPFFQDYRPYLDLLRLSCERYGHRHLVLTDDPMEVGADDAYPVTVPRSLMKAVIAAQLAYLSDPAMANEPTLLVGADCVLAQDPADRFGVFDASVDLAITVGDFADCRMNTGAIYIPRPCMVAEIWAEALEHVGDDWGDDQTSLYRAIQQRPTHGLWTARVTELPVDPYNLAPEHPSDDCRRGVVLHFRGQRKRWMADYCKNWFDLGEGITLTVVSNTPDAAVLENIRVNSRRGLPEIRPQKPTDRHAVLVGGGPSAEDTLDEIRWRADEGQTIFALNGAGKWLMDRGVVPDHVVILDPRPSNAAFVTPIGLGSHLLASQCAPEVFEAARGLPVMVWHFVTPGIETVLPRIDPPQELMGGGLTVGLSAMAVAFAMGFRFLHLYGYDSSDRAGAAHAYQQAEDNAESRRVEVWCGGRPFIAQAAMYAQAKAFPEWANTLAEAGALITVHGDGLLPAVARGMHSALPIPGELAA